MKALPTTFLVVVAANALSSCGALLGFPSPETFRDGPVPPPIDPIEGPEHPEILQGLHGWMLEHEWRSADIVTRELPALTERTIHVSEDALDICGPDEAGRFVYGYGEFQSEHLRVVSIGSDVEEEIPLPRTKPRRYIRWFALAPHGGNLAVGSTAEEFWSIGDPIDVELWNLATHEHHSLDAPYAVDGQWFPDARRLLVEVITPRPDLGLDYRGRDIRKLHAENANDRAIKILDVESGAISALRAGTQPKLAPDGKRMSYLDPARRWQIHELDTGEERLLTLPAALGGPYAWLGPDTVLYPARPTVGQDPGILRTPTKFPRANWTAKAAHPGGTEFVTVSASVGRFQAMSVCANASDP